MKDLHFNNLNTLQQYIDKHKVKSLGYGKDGTCFLLDDNSVIKLLYSDYYPDYVLQFKDIDSSSFIFAKNCAYVGNYVRAVIMEYVQGTSLSKNKPLNQKIDLLADQLQVLTDSLNSISSQGILIKDFHCRNIIYDEISFKIIDTLPYLYLSGRNYKEDNLYEVMNRIYSFLLEDIMGYREIAEQYGYIGDLDKLANPSSYLRWLKLNIESSTDQSINTLDEAEKVLQKKYFK